MGKLIKKFSAILVLLMLLIPSVAFASSGQKNEELTNVELNVEDVNVYITTHSGENVRIDHNVSKFNASMSKKDNNISINLTKKKGASNNLLDMVVVYIPDVSYGIWTVNGNNAGITLPKINSNFKINSVNSAINVCVPENFTKTVDYKIENGAGAIKFAEEYSNFEVNAKIKDSAVSVSKNWTAYESRKENYSYKSGKDGAKFNFDIKNSAFSFNQIHK